VTTPYGGAVARLVHLNGPPGIGKSTLSALYADRNLGTLNLDAVLAELGLDTVGFQTSPTFTDTPGELVMAAACQQGLEGVIAKRADSVHQPGRRSRAWIKTPIRHTAEVVIAGWAASTGNEQVLGSLLLGANDAAGELIYVGDVGTGFTDAARRHMLAQPQPLERPDSPFRGPFVRARGWPGRPPARGTVH
jgi:bifunctional non-homologous end joining protein LigD